jgi:hypothetical protein
MINHDGIEPGYVYIYRINNGPLMGRAWMMNKGPILKKS